MRWWDLEFSAVVLANAPCCWVPDFKTVPWLPHSNDLSSSCVDPEVVRSLGPVVNFHSSLEELDEKILSSDEANVGTGGVHEVVS